MSAADAVADAAPVVVDAAAQGGDAPVDAAPAAPQRNPARLARILRNPGKDKPEPRNWRGDIAHNANGSVYTWESVGVSAAFVAEATGALSEEECERAAQRLAPLREEDKALAERAARFGGAVDATSEKKSSVVSTGVAVDELASAKRLARFGAIPQEVPKKQPQQLAQKNKKDGANQKNQKATKGQEKKAGQDGGAGKKKDGRADKVAEKAKAAAEFFKPPQDDETKAAMAARAARFGA